MLMADRQRWVAVLAMPILQRGNDLAVSLLREWQHTVNMGKWSLSSRGIGALGVSWLCSWRLAACMACLGGSALGLGCGCSSPELKMPQSNGRTLVCS